MSLCNFTVFDVAFVGHINKSKNNKKRGKTQKIKRGRPEMEVEDDPDHLCDEQKEKKKLSEPTYVTKTCGHLACSAAAHQQRAYIFFANPCSLRLRASGG